jgi:hypothetical protein
MAHCLLVSPIVPTGRGAIGLHDVLSSALDAVRGRPNALRLPRRNRVVVVVVDGLGAEALAARSGHARTMAGAMTKAARIRTGSPTTTAAALATLVTGRQPGEHGIVGYTTLEPESDRVVNQLHGFDDGGLPDGWLRGDTVFERAAAEGVGAFAIGPRANAGSGFTRAVLRGAEYLGAGDVADRFHVARAALRGHRTAIGYLYVPELDQIAHREGWSGGAWTAALETVDGAVADAVRALGAGETLLLTADHGILDVPQDRHVLLDAVPGLLDDVRHLAGEPRLVHVHLQPGVPAEEAAVRWRAALEGVADVFTRTEAVEQLWFGAAVDDAVLPRIGDLLVAARGRGALYGAAESTGRGMVGQHGAWSSTERTVPLLRFDG